MKYIKLEGCERSAPLTHVIIDSEEVIARLDTGADITTVPERFVSEENSLESSLRVRDFCGNVSCVPVFLKELTVFNKIFVIKVITSKSSHILLGIDILSAFLITFGKKEYNICSGISPNVFLLYQ